LPRDVVRWADPKALSRAIRRNITIDL